jgi:uncharacterized cupredoxin-like copper-binding protein
MRRPLTAAALGGVATLALLSACSSKDAGDSSVAVTASDSACEVARTDLSSGTTTFRVTNEGNDVTEVYVYAAGDQIMGEVENIGPGTSRDLTVDLGGGTYEVACKPGQTGDGIRTTITVSGAATTQPAPDRTVAMDAYDYGYHFMDDLSFTVGDTVEFTLTNSATDEQHEFEVTGPTGDVLGEIGPTDPGQTGRVVLTFTEPGTYVYECGITDHAEKGMEGELTVAPA